MNWLPLDRYCYFEIAYLVKMLYPSLFNLTLNISRLVDAEPSVLFKQNILLAQKRLTKTLLPLELVANQRDKDEEYAEHLKKVDAFATELKELKEKKKAEDDLAAANAAAIYAETPPEAPE